LAAKLPGFSQALARDPQISDYDKWAALCKVFPNLEGNHVHQWMHLDLRKMFGIKELLSAETANKVWEKANDRLRQKNMLPQAILRKVRAKVIFTTDDPADDLIYHKMADSIEGITFLPTFRPDAYCNIFDDKWKLNVEKICQLTRQETTLKGFVKALRVRHSYFAERGAKASDHGLLEPYGLKISQKRAEQIFKQAYNKEKRFNLRSNETKEFISYMMHQFCGMNQEKGMVTQIHYGAIRNANRYLFKKWGIDVGGDVSAENVHNTIIIKIF